MSWKFPKHRPINTDSMDPEEVNENFFPVVEELSGKLNEHNFSKGMLTDGSKFEDDAGLSITHMGKADDPTWAASATPTPPTPPIVMKLSDAWVPLTYTPNVGANPEQMELTFETEGGPLWIISSFQAQMGSTVLHVDAGNEMNAAGYCFVLSLDGDPLFESLFGGGDTSNDEVRSSTNFSQGPASQAAFLPVKLEAYVDVPPGRYTVGVQYRNLYQYGGNPTLIGVWSRELIVIEMHR